MRKLIKGAAGTSLVRWSLTKGMLAGIARATGAAAIAGIGWKLGADLYDLVKRWLATPLPPPPDRPADGDAQDDPDRRE